MNFDVFNGDADGICALVQLRLAEPRVATRVSGVKRDIALLERVEATAGDSVTVLDVSLDKNRTALLTLLTRGVSVFYVDHHQASDVPSHQGFSAIIDTDADVCTSLLIDRLLQHRFSAWAITGAFGDNLHPAALKLAQNLGLNAGQTEQLKQLGVCINYNAYGASIDDLHIHPVELYQELATFTTPFDFLAAKPALYRRLLDGYHNDMALAWHVESLYRDEQVAIFMLPDQAWARRVAGVWSNELANRHPERAHAVLSRHPAGGHVVSVRAPLSSKSGADEVCSRFPGGGGRKAAAGINQLADESVAAFIDAMADFYRR
ncbi:MAG: DHH family phosphoesterase [Methylomonas sp.]|nr:DHH family phosphoesterase [Methylomonas sp.]PPD19646.1 MAG: acetyltransferase [Methylomonas sp.]PPD24197.1 MAG: acetyltransferase [Methylomonas sp.]PPD32768.1 MAG: acetyltransferase [Methylomonas sp.]PPD41199.1 MAG: acetyltransferase [Methylomonas sp.]